MGATQPVYHDGLQMSVRGRGTLEMVRAEKEGRKTNANESLSWSVCARLFLGPSVVRNGHDRNWSLGEMFCVPLTEADLCPPLLSEVSIWHSVLHNKDLFNCSF